MLGASAPLGLPSYNLSLKLTILRCDTVYISIKFVYSNFD